MACLVGFMALTVDPASAIESGAPFRDATASAHLGDFDKMAERRHIRVLIPYSKMSFFVDGDTLHGVTVDLLRDFEKQLNAKVKDKSKRIFIFMVPTPRDRLLDDLIAGRGDIIAANLTITPERQEKIAFADPLLTGVRELVVTASGAADLTKIEDLSGQSITVRRSSSYFASLEKILR